MPFIHHIIEPNRLLLVWQETGSRLRRVVGELIRDNPKSREITLHYLQETPDYEAAIKKGFRGYPAFKPGREYKGETVLDAFLRRLPAKSRADFPKYLRYLRIPQESQISDFDLLGYSDAKLPGDNFSIINPFEDSKPPFEFLTEISGLRYYSQLDDIPEEGLKVNFEKEPENAFDPDAIKIMLDQKKIGYVNRAQIPLFNKWLPTGQLEAVVERFNGSQDKPTGHLFIKINPPNGNKLDD